TANHRSIKYGDGVFESIRVINGKSTFINKNLKRLFKTAALIKLNVKFSTDEIKQQIALLLEKNQIQKSGRIRISLYRNAEGFYKPASNECDLIIEATKIDALATYELNMPGLVVDIYKNAYKPLHFLSEVKSSSSLLYVLAAEWAKQHYLDDALLINEKKNICEATSSNLFWVKNAVVYTPPISEGCLPGIMREVLIELMQKNNLEIFEKPCTENDLLEADELFLSNAIHGIKWIVAYKNKRYFTNTAKKLINYLNQLI
ncbi:MAG: aminotransferase class IV, partial [Bacteroidia bacterium]